ncbi:hypothetical protein SANTM175S_01095 [Streptomyces antimycoticus]
MSARKADTLGGRAAVVGIGATEFSKDSGRSELKLAVEAVQAALDDAGLTPADVDGLVTFTMDTSPEITVAQACGIGDLTFFCASTTAGARPAPPCSRPRSPSRPVSPRSSSATARSTSAPGAASARAYSTASRPPRAPRSAGRCPSGC